MFLETITRADVIIATIVLGLIGLLFFMILSDIINSHVRRLETTLTSKTDELLDVLKKIEKHLDNR